MTHGSDFQLFLFELYFCIEYCLSANMHRIIGILCIPAILRPHFHTLFMTKGM